MKYVRSLDQVGDIVHDLAVATAFFLNVGLEREGAISIQGEWVDNATGLKDVQTDVVFVRTPDGSGKLELIKLHTPADNEGPSASAANRLGVRHIAFVVDDLNAFVDKLQRQGMNTVGKSRTTKTSIGSATYAAPRESSSSWPSGSARRQRAEPAPPGPDAADRYGRHSGGDGQRQVLGIATLPVSRTWCWLPPRDTSAHNGPPDEEGGQLCSRMRLPRS
jgi:hypothetical protein